MSDTFHFAEADELEGLALARLVSRLGVEPKEASTFLWEGGGSISEAWDRWVQLLFVPILAPVFCEVHRLAAQVRPLEIAVLDRQLDADLEGFDVAGRLRSLEAGKAFLEGKAKMQANREWTRFVEHLEAGAALGHTVTLFALQAALYHLSLAPSLAAFVWFELESGLPRGGYRGRAGSREEALTLFAEALPYLRLAMRPKRDDFDHGTPPLRAI